MTRSRGKFNPTTKLEVLQMIERMPDDASVEDIMYALYVRQRIDAGLRDLAEGRTLTQEEVERNLAEWLRSDGQETPSET